MLQNLRRPISDCLTKPETMMNKKQLKQFKKISKGTKSNPTMVLTTWSIWHSLPYKVQTSKLRNIIIVSEKDDWAEDVWVHKDVDTVFDFHGIRENIIIVGDSAHVRNFTVSKALSKGCTTTVFDVELNVEPYEYIV